MALASNICAAILLLCTGFVQSLVNRSPEAHKIDVSLLQPTHDHKNKAILADPSELVETPSHPLKDHKNKTFLADSSEYLKKPRHVLKKMSNHVGELESRLTSVQQQHTAEVSMQKAALEEKLSQQADENKKIKQENDALESDIKKLQESKQAKHDLAKDLVNQNNGLKNSIQNLLSNMSYAQEFTEGALSDAALKLRNSSELQILRDLEAQDAARLNELEHARSLKAVADPSKVSMLEVGARLKRRQHPQDLLEKLAATLSDLAKEQNASVISLQEQFDDKFHQGEVRRQALLDKQAELVATKAQEQELNQRLADAVGYLRTTRDNLLAKIQSVQKFMASVSHTALPRREEQPSLISKEELGKNIKENQILKAEEKQSKKKKEHKKKKAALVQVHPKVAPRKAKKQKNNKHGEAKPVGEHAKEHEHDKAAQAKTASNQGKQQEAEIATSSSEQVKKPEESSTASSWLSWLSTMVSSR